ncbi:MAG: pilus assembly protein PilM [Fimbriimonas ginsengisoli]|nr:pilus assembly protein PilM [Fimbriimonas ginsengisoli]
MARSRGSTLGIELHERYVRVVEVSDSAQPVILALGEAAMPPGVVHDGSITKPDAIALSVRRVLDAIGVNTQEAVIGVPAASTILRTLTVPPVPDSELPHIIDGEFRHFGMLQSQDAAYSYFPMPGARGGDIGSSLNVLLLGAEGSVISALREVATKAMVHVIALEPVHIGMYRAASDALSGPSTMVLTVSESRSNMTLHAGGEVCLFREVELGTDILLKRHAGDDPFANPGTLGKADAGGFKLDPDRVNVGPANTLAIELKRSVEYFNREYQGGEPIDKLVVVTCETAFSDVVPWLSNELGLPVEILSSFKAPTDRESIANDLTPPAGARYEAAYGLAMRGAYLNRKKVPHMDLYVRERSVAELEEKRKGIAGSLLVAILAILVGVFFAYRNGQEANQWAHQLDHLRDDINEQQLLYNRNAEQEVKLRKQIDTLAQDGVPVSRLIDVVASRVTGPIGLTDIQADNTGKVTFAGEAIDEDSVIKVADRLKTDPLILSANVASFEKIDPESTKQGFKFHIASQGRFGKPPGAQP